MSCAFAICPAQNAVENLQRQFGKKKNEGHLGECQANNAAQELTAKLVTARRITRFGQARFVTAKVMDWIFLNC
jgi:hypothetical protein